jgi:hypothetical protein
MSLILRSCVLGVLGLVLAASAGTGAALEASAPRWVMDAQTGCYIYHVDSRPADGVFWSGACADRVASGTGTAMFTQSGRFTESISGTFARGAAQGAVRINWADGSHFEGRAAAGRFSGPGVLTTASGDRFDGEWSNAGSGRGTIAWTNGDRYNGAWKSQQPEGQGVLTRKDGSRTEGEFSAGVLKPVPPAPVLATGETKQPLTADRHLAEASAGTDVLSSAAVGAVTPEPGSAPEPKPTILSRWLAGVGGRTLVAADGSSFRAIASGDAVRVEIASATGAAEKTDFKFLNSNQGVIAAGQHPEAVLGTFRVSDSALVAEYADGRTDRLLRDAAGALALSSALPDGRSFCTRWYAEGHEFSTAEREAALNEYARQLGVARKAKMSQECVAVAVENVPAAAKRRTHAAPAGNSKTAVLAPVTTDEPVQVRTAAVQPIDPLPAPASAELEPISAGIDRQTAIWQADTAPGPDIPPQNCLSVRDEDGSWGFQNRCGYDVQFAYCVRGLASRSCDAGARLGTAAANAFAGLFPESEARNADYGFRWIACKGGAHDVEPRLVRAEPPAGRCLKMPGGTILLAAKTHGP